MSIITTINDLVRGWHDKMHAISAKSRAADEYANECAGVSNRYAGLTSGVWHDARSAYLDHMSLEQQGQADQLVEQAQADRITAGQVRA